MGFESVEDLRARIAESVTSQKADMMPRLKENACLYALAERVEGDVPEAMLEDAEASLIQDFFQQLQSQGMTFDVYLAQQGITPDQFKEDVKKQAEDMSKQDLALDAWARHFGMEATAEEVTEEFVKSGVEDPAALEAEWRSNGQLHMVRQGVIRTKAVKDIMDKAVVTELDLSRKRSRPRRLRPRRRPRRTRPQATSPRRSPPRRPLRRRLRRRTRTSRPRPTTQNSTVSTSSRPAAHPRVVGRLEVTKRYPGLAQRSDKPHYGINASRPPSGRKRQARQPYEL